MEGLEWYWIRICIKIM